jgi:hypothetical protein
MKLKFYYAGAGYGSMGIFIVVEIIVDGVWW